jgi:hypothetical protein
MTSDQYEGIVYLSVATAAADDVSQLRLASKVLDKLEKIGVRKPDDAGYRLIDETATVRFEDAEAEFVLQRIEQMIPNLQVWMARGALTLIDQLNIEVVEEAQV